MYLWLTNNKDWIKMDTVVSEIVVLYLVKIIHFNILLYFICPSGSFIDHCSQISEILLICIFTNMQKLI